MSLPSTSPSTTAIVTGASSGIGAEIAKVLAARGQNLTLVARRTELLEQLATELRDQWKVVVDVAPCDLSDATARKALIDGLESAGKQVTILVNNAGFGTVGRIASANRDRELGMVRTNVEALLDLTTLLLPKMLAAKTGAILNVASTAAFQPIPGQAGYAATKAFVLSYTDALVAELVGTGVTATSLCPGPVETGFAEAADFQEGDTDALGKMFWVEASEVAELAVAALASGQRQIIPGMANKALASIGRHSPKRLILALGRKVHPAMKRP